MFLIDIGLNKYVIEIFIKWWNVRICSDCYQNQQMCNKALDNYSSVKVVNTYPSTIQFVPD